MDKVLREILRKSPYFEEINENRFVPEYLGLIVTFRPIRSFHLFLKT